MTTPFTYIFKKDFQKKDLRVSQSDDDEASSLLGHYIT
jgi:hypothetical protein